MLSGSNSSTFAVFAAIALALCPGPAAGAPAPPPGHNVRLVRETSTGRFWRGGAPTQQTLQGLQRDRGGRGVTLFDLRTPPNKDDRSGKGGRLTPQQEAAAAQRLGFHYVAVSALDRRLPQKLQNALKQGDIYIHCMYGVNRTGFAVARYAQATGTSVGREGLGKRDWSQGEAYQRRLGSGATHR